MRPERQPLAPRSDIAHPAPARPDQVESQPRPQPGWSNPLARPAPPVHEKSPQQAQQEENKYQRWEQRSQQSQPRARQPEQKSHPEQQRQPDKDKHH